MTKTTPKNQKERRLDAAKQVDAAVAALRRAVRELDGDCFSGNLEGDAETLAATAARIREYAANGW